MILSRIDNINNSWIGDFFEDNTFFCEVFMDETMTSEIIFHPFFGDVLHIHWKISIKSLIKHIARATVRVKIIFSIYDPV